KWLAGKARRDDLAVFAFIGQGFPEGERSCYFTIDSTVKDRAKNALTAEEGEHELEKLKSQRVCALIELNFKRFNPGKEPLPDTVPDKFYSEFFIPSKDDLESEDSPRNRGRIVFLSNDHLAPSLDLEKHGLFTQAVLKGLQGAADKEGYEADGVI